MARDCLYVIDTFSLMFQVFHAIPAMTGTRGQPTNAVFGMTRDLFSLLELKPTHLICAIDSPGPGKREEIYAEYKAHRGEIPEDLTPQIPLIRQLLRGFRIPDIDCPGWEADDVIATVAEQAVARGMDVVIVSTDKDNRQLLRPEVRMWNCRKNEFFTEASLLEDWGIRPDQVVDFQSLVGDAVDNVPGVPKVGPKTAKTLIEQFGNLDEILAHADRAPGKKLQENLRQYADQALLSRELVRLRRNLPLEIDFEAARVCEPDAAALLELFTDLGFRSYAAKMRAVVGVTGESGTGSVDSAGALASGLKAGGDSASSAGPSTGNGPSQRSVQTSARQQGVSAVTSDDVPRVELMEAAGVMAAERELASAEVLCVEPLIGGSLVRDRVLTGAVLLGGGREYRWSRRASVGDEQQSATAVALLKLLSGFRGELCVVNAKPLCHVLLNADLPLPAMIFDASIADYLLDAGARGHSLMEIAERHGTGAMLQSSSAVSKPRQRTMFDDDGEPAAAGEEEVIRAAAGRLQVLMRVCRPLKTGLETEGLLALYRDLEEPLIRVLARMEHTGIRVEAAELCRQSVEIGGRIETLTAEIFRQAGRTFNIDSPKQLSAVLFTDLKLPVIRKTQTGASTDQEVLEELANLHPLPAAIIERRHLIKLRGTYLDALPALVHPRTGRIHTSFHQTVAATGRLSSSDPNLQNIPVRTAEGRQVRAAFRPESEDWTLICADYSQIELRVLAHFSGDAALCEAFREGLDIHAAVAADVFAVPLAEVTGEQRRIAKAVNFGVIYGQTPWGLAAALGIEKDAAAEFIDQYFRRYAGVAAFCEQVLEETARSGYARTLANRRRAITGIRRTTGLNRNMPERTAINTVLQGTAADLIKQAMLNVQRLLDETHSPARLLLQIHDELVLECPKDAAAGLIPQIRDCMQNAMQLNVPLVVDVTTGSSWLDQRDED
ncbi:MAG: DNA polymerase I [Planctomycetota bacterium]